MLKMRLFIAIDVSGEIKEDIAKLKSFLEDVQGIRTVSDDNLHFTLKFLGDVGEENLEPVKKALSQVRFNPFKLRINKPGCFPNEDYVRVLWVDTEQSDELLSLKNNIDQALPGFKDDYEFRNHLTFARVKHLSPEDKKKVIELITNARVEKKEFLVDKFKLYKSALTPKGPVYEVAASFS